MLGTSMEFQEPWAVGLDREALLICFYEYLTGPAISREPLALDGKVARLKGTCSALRALLLGA